MQVTPAPEWRIRFDVPHNFAVAPGYARAQHCHDFREDKGTMQNTYRDPLTGVLMLRPSWMTEALAVASHWKVLSDWQHDPDYWQAVYGGPADQNTGSPTARFYSTVYPQGGDFSANSVQAGVGVSVLGITQTSARASDALYWGLQSNFTLARDEGFVYHYRTLAREYEYLNNWFGVQFADFYFHFSLDGICRVYQYLSGLSVAPTLIDEFSLASPGDLSGRDGYIIFQPIPAYGFCIVGLRTWTLPGAASVMSRR